MIVLPLLVVALILLVVGVIVSSAGWLLISLAVSLLAGSLLYLLHHSRRTLSPKARMPADETANRSDVEPAAVRTG